MSSILQQIEDLRNEAINCQKCDLAKTRTNVVFGEGNPETPLVIIGEGPGANEDATGRPFVGRAGQLLDEALRECGITRKHVFICNVVKCRACIIEAGSIKNRPPRVEEVEACFPWLLKQLEIIKPLVILSLGAPSANVIIHKDFKMTKERGLWFETPYANAAIAALHPSYVLRQMSQGYPEARDLLVKDIESARRKVIELKKQISNK